MEMFFCCFPCFQSDNSTLNGTLCPKNKQKLKAEQLKAVERQLAKQECWTSSKQLWDESIDSKLCSSGKEIQDDPTKLDYFFVNSKSSLATKWLTLTRPAPPGGCHCQRDGRSMPGQTGWTWNEVTWRCATFWVLFCIMRQRDCSLLGVRAAIVILFIPMDSVLRVCFL